MTKKPDPDYKFSMPFSIDSTEKLISHWLLNCDSPTVVAIADTLKGSKNPRAENLVASITVNGVELPFKGFENFLQSFCESAFNDAKAEFADMERAVQARLEKRMKAEAQPIIDKLYDFQQHLEELDSVIVPYYEQDRREKEIEKEVQRRVAERMAKDM